MKERVGVGERSGVGSREQGGGHGKVRCERSLTCPGRNLSGGPQGARPLSSTTLGSDAGDAGDFRLLTGWLQDLWSDDRDRRS